MDRGLIGSRKWYSAAELHRLWNAEKKADPSLAWWAENSKCSYQESFRGRCKDSFRLYGALRCGRGAVTLPRLGVIKTHESTRKLARRLDDSTARILSATISRTAQRWFVSFTVQVEREVPAATRLARLHARIANLRADALHKATSALAAAYERVVVEDLNVTRPVEPGTRHPETGQDRDRQRATTGCGMNAR